MRNAIALIAFALGALAAAAPKTTVLGAGECGDGELVGYVRAFSERLRPRLGPAFLDPAATQEKLRPVPRVSLEEIQRQLEAAQSHFYSLQLAKAEDLARSAEQDAAGLAPGETRVKLSMRAWLIQALLFRQRGDSKKAEDMFRRVLRLAPSYLLDPNYYSPSMRSDFEVERKRVAAAPKVRLSVKSSPSGADVFLDGLKAGKTPYRGDHLAGDYALQLAKGDAASFLHPLELQGPLQVQVDLDFEASVHSQPIPCIAGSSEGALLSNVVRVGAGVDADEVVVMRLERQSAGPSWLAASLVSVERGQKTREGGMKVRGDAQTEAALGDLVDFIVTGQVSRNVVVVVQGAEQLAAPWAAHPEPAPPPAPAPPVAVAAAAPPLQPAPRRPMGMPGGWRLTAALSSAGVAAALAAGAGAVRLAAQGDIDALKNRLTPEGYVPAGDLEAQRLQSSLGARSSAIDGLLIGAAVGAGAAATFFFLPGGEKDGASAALYGGAAPGAAIVGVAGRF